MDESKNCPSNSKLQVHFVVVKSDAIATAELGQDVHEAIKSLHLSRHRWDSLCTKGFEHGRDYFHPSHISPLSLPSPSCSLQGNDLVVRYVGMFLVLEAEGLDGLAKPDL